MTVDPVPGQIWFCTCLTCCISAGSVFQFDFALQVVPADLAVGVPQPQGIFGFLHGGRFGGRGLGGSAPRRVCRPRAIRKPPVTPTAMASKIHRIIQAPTVPDVPIIPPIATYCSYQLRTSCISIADRRRIAQGHMSLTAVTKGYLQTATMG